MVCGLVDTCPGRHLELTSSQLLAGWYADSLGHRVSHTKYQLGRQDCLQLMGRAGGGQCGLEQSLGPQYSTADRNPAPILSFLTRTGNRVAVLSLSWSWKQLSGKPPAPFPQDYNSPRHDSGSLPLELGQRSTTGSVSFPINTQVAQTLAAVRNSPSQL